MKAPDFSNAKIGDEVYSLKYGWGRIISITSPDVTLIGVEFQKDRGTYIENGKVYEDDVVPDLWWNEWTPEPPKSALFPFNQRMRKETALVFTCYDQFNNKWVVEGPYRYVESCRAAMNARSKVAKVLGPFPVEIDVEE